VESTIKTAAPQLVVSPKDIGQANPATPELLFKDAQVPKDLDR